MTQHASRLIIQFMAACCGKSKTRQEAEDAQIREEKPRNVPSNTVPLTRVHAILERMSRGEDDETVPVRPGKNKTKTTEAPGEETSGADVDAPALRQSTQIQSSMRTTARLWPAHTREWPADVVDVRNTSLSTRPEEPKATSSRLASKQRKSLHAEAQQARAYVTWRHGTVREWMERVCHEPEAPNAEQYAFLERVVARCRAEQAELAHVGRPGHTGSEPCRDCVFGIPGAGKSTCIKLVRRFFEECLGWEHGVQFQFLATQNSMAELIGGQTVHTWGVIPTNKAMAAARYGAKDVDWDQLFENALSLRWLIIDECSTIAPSLLATLESFLRE